MKEARHDAILRIIRSNDIGTQERLAEMLRQSGFEVTQATVSRDIRELGLVKAADGEGGYRYVVPASPPAADAIGRVQRAFQDYVLDIMVSDNLIMIKTTSGSAQLVAAALDRLNLPQVLGSVAGDDTILVVVDDGRRREPSGPVADLYQTFLGWRG